MYQSNLTSSMIPPRSFIVFFIPIIQTLLLSIGIYFEYFYLYLAITAFIITDVLLYFLLPTSISRLSAAALSAPPIVLFLSTAGALVFVDNMFAIIAVIMTNALVTGTYLYALPSRLTMLRNETVQPPAIFIGAFGMLIVALAFQLTLILFAFLYFLDIPFWVSILPYLGALLSIVFVYFHERGIQRIHVVMLISIAAVCLAEIIYSLTWLPLAYLPSTALVTIAWIVMMDSLLGYRMKYTLLTACIMLLLIATVSVWR